VTSYSFSTLDLSGMQAAQDNHMMDTCTIDRYTDGGTDPYGAPTPTWVSDDPIACGFHVFKVDEVLGQTKVAIAAAQVRLPIGTTLDLKDRITITKRHGVAVDNVSYAIAGDPVRGPSGLLVDLERVTDGS